VEIQACIAQWPARPVSEGDRNSDPIGRVDSCLVLRATGRYSRDASLRRKPI
jgi:hypothetical protein